MVVSYEVVGEIVTVSGDRVSGVDSSNCRPALVKMSRVLWKGTMWSISVTSSDDRATSIGSASTMLSWSSRKKLKKSPAWLNTTFSSPASTSRLRWNAMSAILRPSVQSDGMGLLDSLPLSRGVQLMTSMSKTSGLVVVRVILTGIFVSSMTAAVSPGAGTFSHRSSTSSVTVLGVPVPSVAVPRLNLNGLLSITSEVPESGA